MENMYFGKFEARLLDCYRLQGRPHLFGRSIGCQTVRYASHKRPHPEQLGNDYGKELETRWEEVTKRLAAKQVQKERYVWAYAQEYILEE